MNLNQFLFFYLNDFAGKAQWFDNIVIFCAEYLPYILVALFLSILIFGKKTSREKINFFIFTAISVFASRILITEAIRYFYPVSRPFMINFTIKCILGLHCPPVTQLIYHVSSSSFPSGHAVFFFALATVVVLGNLVSRWKLSFQIFFFAGAILIGLARVIAGIHWPYDILAGAIVGVLSSWIVYLFFKSKLQNRVDSV